jgi:hypothetical protein
MVDVEESGIERTESVHTLPSIVAVAMKNQCRRSRRLAVRNAVARRAAVRYDRSGA